MLCVLPCWGFEVAVLQYIWLLKLQESQTARLLVVDVLSLCCGVVQFLTALAGPNNCNAYPLSIFFELLHMHMHFRCCLFVY